MACTSTEATAIVDGIELTLAKPDRHAAHWIDFNDYARRLEAAWLRLDDAEPQLSPRIVG